MQPVEKEPYQLENAEETEKIENNLEQLRLQQERELQQQMEYEQKIKKDKEIYKLQLEKYQKVQHLALKVQILKNKKEQAIK